MNSKHELNEPNQNPEGWIDELLGEMYEQPESKEEENNLIPPWLEKIADEGPEKDDYYILLSNMGCAWDSPPEQDVTSNTSKSDSAPSTARSTTINSTQAQTTKKKPNLDKELIGTSRRKELSAELKTLGYAKKEYQRLIRQYNPKNIQQLRAFHGSLIKHHLTHQDICRIAEPSGGFRNLKAISDWLTSNPNPLSRVFTLEQIVKVVSYGGGSKNLSALLNADEAKVKALGLNAEQLVRVVSHGGGSKNLSA